MVVGVSAAWTTIAVLAVATAAIKAAGPVALGGRPLPPHAAAVIAFLAPALLAALVITETIALPDKSLVLDERAAGLLAAAIAIWLRASLPVIVIVAAVAAAAARAIG
jgi:branched-subunit amino acid transport protein